MMKKEEQTLFKIGEVTKTMGITRKTLLVFESAGLLTPAFKDNESGYRYYSADNMMQIRAIRSLQALGLSLKEIAEYYYNTDNIDALLEHLIEQRAILDRNIHLLQVRSAKRGDLTVHRAYLPQQVCYCREVHCEDLVDAAGKLRETYLAALRTGKMSTHNRMFTLRTAAPDKALDIMCCIPVSNDFDGPERVDFPDEPALCIYFRGPYEEITDAVRAMIAYTEEHNIETTGPYRCVYLEGPPNRGKNSEDYITQIAVPIHTST